MERIKEYNGFKVSEIIVNGEVFYDAYNGENTYRIKNLLELDGFTLKTGDTIKNKTLNSNDSIKNYINIKNIDNEILMKVYSDNRIQFSDYIGNEFYMNISDFCSFAEFLIANKKIELMN
jgi:hypothetical protein